MRIIISILSVFLTICYADSSGENLPLGGPAGSCPIVDDENPIYLLDLKNQYVFYECANGNPYLQYCKGGLVFNPNKDICDFTCNDCDPYGPVGKCLVVNNSKFPVFLRDGFNQKVFYMCVNGEPKMMKCAEELVFNPYKNSCVIDIDE